MLRHHWRKTIRLATLVDEGLQVKVISKFTLWDTLEKNLTSVLYVAKDSLPRVNSQSHTRTSHRRETIYKCTECGQAFRNNRVICEWHMLTHTGEKPYKCDICGAMFTHRGGLRMHIITHTSLKPFVCTICDKAFTTKGQSDKTQHDSHWRENHLNATGVAKHSDKKVLLRDT